jgi:hypothetical protein
VRFSIVVVYLAGCALALGAWGLTQYVPSKPVALLMLGATPFLVRVLPKNLKPNPESVPQTILYGVMCTTLMLLTGVSGPLFDSFFLGGNLDRREIVATKSVCQLFGHAMKLAYFTLRRLLSGLRLLPSVAAAALMEAPMQNIEPLIFDLVEWVAQKPRTQADVMDTWRTSCPRLTVWEDALDRGLVARKKAGQQSIVVVTPRGLRFLEDRIAARAI